MWCIDRKQSQEAQMLLQEIQLVPGGVVAFNKKLLKHS